MRYFLSGFSLFLLMTLFVRSWYVQTMGQAGALLGESEVISGFNISPKLSDAKSIHLQDDLLLRPVDYEVIDDVVLDVMDQPGTMLLVYFSETMDATRLKNTLLSLFEDREIPEPRIQFLRKPSEQVVKNDILFVVQ